MVYKLRQNVANKIDGNEGESVNRVNNINMIDRI